MKPFIVILTALYCFSNSVFACRRVGNSPYVQSIEENGQYYARCVPTGALGIEGSTTIYRVGTESDEKLDTYNWYSPKGVTLGWSPMAKKVAVMTKRGGVVPKKDKVEFSFYLGGQFLQSYTTQEVIDLGVQSVESSCGIDLIYTVVGVQQIINTSNYAFVVEFDTTKEEKNLKSRLYFNILTGKLISQ